MKFLLIMNKDGEGCSFDDSTLSSVKAPSLIADSFVKKQISNSCLYMYLYNQIYEESEGDFYKLSDEDAYFYNGLVSIHGSNQIPDIESVFDAIYNNQLILGDFQAVHIDGDDNVFIKTSDSSIYPLFYFEDEHCFVLSNELKLIVDGIDSFRTNFVNSFNYDFMEEIFFKGFFYKKERDDYRRTIFKDIRRILPHDDISISNGEAIINQNSDIDVPKWFEDWYLEDADSLYDWYYESVMEYTESLIKRVADNIEEIRIGITGGFDSRITLAILNQICGKYGIRIRSHTSGLPDHPDVVIGHKVADCLGVPWTNPSAADRIQLKRVPHTFREYASTFYESQGDFDSHDFLIFYERNINDTTSFYQNGMDVYKREEMASIINYNRWFSRRILCTGNFYFPLLSTNFELWFSRLYDKHHKGESHYKEFVYNVLKRANPELLEIPYAFDFLPQLDLEPFVVEGYDSTLHKLCPFLWDYRFVYNELNPVLEERFEKVNGEHDSVLSDAGLNCLDYFLLKDRITGVLTKSDRKDHKKKLVSLKNKAFYPKNRTYIDLEEFKSKGKVRSLMKVMDWACAASHDSFYSIEKYAHFNCENNVYDAKEKIYEDYGVLETKNNELSKDNEALNKKSEKLAEEITRLKDVNDAVLNSHSWKVTGPLRGIVNKIKK